MQYSGISLVRIPLGPHEMSRLKRCPYYSVLNEEISLSQRSLIERFHCTTVTTNHEEWIWLACQKSELLCHKLQNCLRHTRPFPSPEREWGEGGGLWKHLYNNFTHSSHGICHVFDKCVCSVGTGTDDVTTASMEPSGTTTLICGSRVTVEPAIKKCNGGVILMFVLRSVHKIRPL